MEELIKFRSVNNSPVGVIMIILPWIPATFWIVLTLTVLTIVCYLLILPALCKNRKMDLLALLTVMLLSSQVFFIMFIVFGKIVYNISFDDQSDTQKMDVYGALEFSCLGLYYILFCVVHWVFSMKYWVIAREMQVISREGAEH